MANPPPGSTAAIREALVDALVDAACAFEHHSSDANAERLSSARQALLASLSPEAAPAPASMPQIEVGDDLVVEDVARQRFRWPVMAEIDLRIPDHLKVHSIRRVIWRRAEAPRP